MNLRRTLIGTTLGFVVASALFIMVILLPKVHEIAKTRAALETAQQQESSLRASLAQLKEVRRNAPATMAKLATIAAYLPSSPDLPGFIRLLQTASSESGIDLLSIAPTQPQTLANASGIQTIGVTLSITGGFHRIEDFLTRIENLSRVVEVTAMALSPTVDPLSGQTIETGTVNLTMFVVQPNASLSATVSGAPGTVGGTVPSPSPGASASPSPGAS